RIMGARSRASRPAAGESAGTGEPSWKTVNPAPLEGRRPRDHPKASLPAELPRNGPSHMFDRFTDRAKKVMNLARQEAQRFNHEYLGTEHILLGLVQEGSGVAANVLKNMG